MNISTLTKRIWWIIAVTVVISIIILIGRIGPGKCPDQFFVQMGTFSDCWKWSAANDISADGLRVVGQSIANCIPGHLHPVEAAGWTRNCIWGGDPFYPKGYSQGYPGSKKGMIELGYLPSAAQSSAAFGISPDGVVTVGCSDVALYEWRPVIFMLSVIELASYGGGVARDVSLKNPSFNYNWGNTKMNNRVVVGFQGRLKYPYQVERTRAVYWRSKNDSVALALPLALPNGRAVMSSEAVCISDDGKTIGGNLYYNMQAEYGNFRSYPCIWKWSGTAYFCIVLQDLVGGDDNARIVQISGDGLVMVGWGNTIAADSTCDVAPKFACKWTPGSGNSWNPVPAKLDPLPGALKYSSAAGTNKNGNIIVGLTFDFGVCPNVVLDSKATLWEKGMTKDVKAELGSVVPAGYDLREAVRVSDNGKIIIGNSYPPGFEIEGWIGGR